MTWNIVAPFRNRKWRGDEHERTGKAKLEERSTHPYRLACN